MKDARLIYATLGDLMDIYENAEDDSRDAELLDEVIGIGNDPLNELTPEDKKVWQREVDKYNYSQQEGTDMTVGDVIDNIRFYIEQPEEYNRVEDWRR